MHRDPDQNSVSDDGGTGTWRAWARAAGLGDEAADEAVKFLRAGASARAAAVAARAASYAWLADDDALLQAELSWIESVVQDLGREKAESQLISRYEARATLVRSALDLIRHPDAAKERERREAVAARRKADELTAQLNIEARERAASEERRLQEREHWRKRVEDDERAKRAQPSQPTASTALHLETQVAAIATTPAKPVAPPKPPAPPRPPRPSFSEFLNEHSILIVSYSGAFLLFIATLLFELYTINFNGTLRFAGVATLDAIFALAGIACLRSKRLNLVGHTYVAIFALLAPLVFVAAYVFLGLGAKGISTDFAFAVAGSACCVLYTFLTLRLKLHAYGVLALIALPVAWLGAVDLFELGKWRGPALAPMSLVFTAVLFLSPRLHAAGDRFSRFAMPFVHVGALLALGFAAYALGNGWTHWVVAVTFAVLTANYLAFRVMGGDRYSSVFALAGVQLTVAAAAYDIPLGVWRPIVLIGLVAAYTVVQLRPGWLTAHAKLFSDDAVVFVHVAVAAALVGFAADLANVSDWIPWVSATVLLGVAVGYGLNRVLGGGEVPAVLAQIAWGLAWLAAVKDLSVGSWAGLAVVPLVVAYAVLGRRGFSKASVVFVHIAAGVAATMIVFANIVTTPIGLWPIAITFAALTGAYLTHTALDRREPSVSLGLASFGIAWIAAVGALGISPWRGAALAPLGTIYAVLASRRSRFIPSTTPYFVHAVLATAAVLLVADMSVAHQWLPAVAAMTALAFTLVYSLNTALHPSEESAALVLILFGLGWLASTDALHLGEWRGVAVSPLVVLYAAVAFRAGRLGSLGGLFQSTARLLAHAAAGIALFLTFASMSQAGQWIVWTGPLTFAVIAAGYLLFALLSGAVEGAVLAQIAFGAAWTLGSNDLNLGWWRGPSVTLLVALYSFIAYRGARFGKAGSLFARHAAYRIHGAAAVALLLTASAASSTGHWLPWTITATFAGLFAAYLFGTLLGGPIEVAVLCLAAFGIAWAGASHDLGLNQWRAAAISAVTALYSVVAFRGRLLGAAGEKLGRHAMLFAYAGAGVGVFFLARELSTAGSWIAYAAAATFAVIGVSFFVATALSGGSETAILSMAALGLAWSAATYDFVPQGWRAASMAPLAAAYVMTAYRGARLGIVGEKFARFAQPFFHGTAVGSLLFLAGDLLVAGWSAWWATAALAAVAAVYVLACFLGGTRENSIIAMATLGVAWASTVNDLGLHQWSGAAVAAGGLLLATVAFRGARLGRVGALFARDAEPFVHLVVGGGLAWTAIDPAGILPAEPMAWVLITSAAVYALYGRLSGRQPALLITALATTAATSFENVVLNLGPSGFATELTLLSAIYGAGSFLTKDRWLTSGLRLIMAVQLAGMATLNPPHAWLQSIDLMAGAAVVTWVAWRSRFSEWLLLSAGLFAVAWYWLASAVLPRPANLAIDNLAQIYSPLPIVFGLVSLGLRSLAGRRWAWPLYAYAVLGAAAVLSVAIPIHDFTLVGVSLLAYSVILYAVGGVELRWEVAMIAGLTAAAGIGSLLYNASAPPEWYPAATFGTSIVLYALQIPWETRFTRASDWIQAHRLTGLGGAAVSALSSFAFWTLVPPHHSGALFAAAGLIGFGLLVIIDGRRQAMPIFDYAGATAISLRGLWIAHYLGATNLEWYVSVPGIAIAASGLRLPYDARIRYQHMRLIAQVLTGAGMLLILGTSAALTVLERPIAWVYTSVLVVEGVVALLAGIGFKSRVLLISGSAGIAVSALRGVVVGITQGFLPIWAVFFAISLILLGLGAALALYRDRLPNARVRLSDSWHEWN